MPTSFCTVVLKILLNLTRQNSLALSYRVILVRVYFYYLFCWQSFRVCTCYLEICYKKQPMFCYSSKSMMSLICCWIISFVPQPTKQTEAWWQGLWIMGSLCLGTMGHEKSWEKTTLNADSMSPMRAMPFHQSKYTVLVSTQMMSSTDEQADQDICFLFWI